MCPFSQIIEGQAQAPNSPADNHYRKPLVNERTKGDLRAMDLLAIDTANEYDGEGCFVPVEWLASLCSCFAPGLRPAVLAFMRDCAFCNSVSLDLFELSARVLRAGSGLDV
jgi:hypothetical protein